MRTASAASSSGSSSGITLSSLRSRVPSLIIIGICGPSASGKSTIAAHLHSHFQSAFPVVGIDHFFDYGEEPWYYTSEAGRRLFDIEYPRSVAFNNMMNAIRSIVHSFDPSQGKNAILILEGFLLFSYLPLLQLIEPQYRFFLCVDGFTCSKRRYERRRGAHSVPMGATVMDGRGVNGCPPSDTNWLRHNDFYMSLVWPAFLHCNAHMIRWAPLHWLGITLPSSSTSTSPTTTPTASFSVSVGSANAIELFYHPQSLNGAYCSDCKGPADDKSGRLPESRWTPGIPPSLPLITAMSRDATTGRLPFTCIDCNPPLMVAIPEIISQISQSMKPLPTLSMLKSLVPDLVIVGIGGASGTGKSNLAAYIHYHFKSSFPLVCMDAFFDDGGQAWRFTSDADNHHYDIEYPRSVRFDRLLDHMHELAKQYRPSKDRLPVMIVEGFLLYSHTALLSLIDPALRFFLVAPPMLCSTRRFVRDHRRVLPAVVNVRDGRGPAGRQATEEASGSQKLWLRHNDFYWSLVWPAFLHTHSHLLRYIPPSLFHSPPELVTAFPHANVLTTATSSPSSATATIIPSVPASPSSTTSASSVDMETKDVVSTSSSPRSTSPTRPSSTSSPATPTGSSSSTSPSLLISATPPAASVAVGTGREGGGMACLYHPLLRIPGVTWCDAISPSTAFPSRAAIGEWLPGSPPSPLLVSLMTRDDITGRLPFVILDGSMPIIGNAPVIVATLVSYLRTNTKIGQSWGWNRSAAAAGGAGGCVYEWDAAAKAARLFSQPERITLLNTARKHKALASSLTNSSSATAAATATTASTDDHKDGLMNDVDDSTLLNILITLLS